MSELTHTLPVHRLHDEEVERLLATGERRADLVALLGEAGYRELSALARRAAVRRPGVGPRVYVLPGLMGSRLGSRGRLLDDVLWVDLVEIAAGHLTRLALPAGARLVALGAILLNTLKLKLSLRVAGLDARMHPYDWRCSVADLAAVLNRRIAAESDGQPVMLVGHSLGGVVARVALSRQRSDHVARVVQLGAPNYGSFAPVLALRGVYPTVRKLAAIDRRHTAEELARIVFRTLPALHELLPDATLTGGADLLDVDSWPDDELRPDPAMLAAARAQRAKWDTGDDRCLHIAGVRQDTVTALHAAAEGFDYEVTSLGDGTVPLRLAVQPGERAWYVGEKHGGLPNNGRVIAAVVDLLRTGTTARLAATPSRVRTSASRRLSEAALRRVAPHKVAWQHLSPDARRRLLEPIVSPEFHGAVEPAALERAFVARRTQLSQPPPARTLEIRLVRGSIADANARALVLGVFSNVDPTGPAAAIDAVLGGAIRELTLRRMFAAQLGQVFVLPVARSQLLAEFVLFAGLGDFDDFGAGAPAFVAENVVRTFARTHVEDFATVLFGAGSGVPVAMALEQQLRGFAAGVLHADPGRVVRRISICEIDARKYRALVTAARGVAAELQEPGLTLVVDEVDITAVPERKPKRSPGADAWPPDSVYLLLSMTESGRAAYACRSALLTAGAKAAVLAGTVELGRADLDQALEPLQSGASTTRDLARIGSGVARLLLPESVRDGLEAMQARPLVVVHDREASRVPWEVLRCGDKHPALAAGLSRRYASDSLTVARWRDARAASDPLRMLLVVDPTRDLPGAAAEGQALRDLLGRQSVTLDVLQGRDATRARIVAALAAGTFDVLHFAGHAFWDERDPGNSGLVCAGSEVLRGRDLDRLGNLPTLVFCNACEAARVRKRPAQRRRATVRAPDPRRTMTGVAETFLAGGVANFLGTHWPVGDESALAFSQSLYTALLRGERLGDAVLAGRRRLLALPSIDWANYVHYGSAEFRLAAGP